MKIVFLGLSITSSWGNGHATNFRGLVAELARAGHDVLFLERDVPWYRAHRDLPEPPYGRTVLYSSVEELRDRFEADVVEADAVVVGSYVPDGIAVGRWVTERARGVAAFYDIDTPVTLAALERGECEYLEPELVGAFDLYLSFTGGPTLQAIEDRWGSPCARAFHCLVDPDAYAPIDVPERWALGYLGTYSDDRQPVLDRLLLDPARQRIDLDFVVAGPQYPDAVTWPPNVERIEHLPPSEHPGFYAAQRCTLNVTRADMVRAGWSPSVRLFEAAACGVPVISDRWEGIETFFRPGTEILLADTSGDVLEHLDHLDDERRASIGAAARARVLESHTAAHRAHELEEHLEELLPQKRRRFTLESHDGHELGPWFHNLHLPDGTQTAPQHKLGDFPAFKWEQIAPSIPDDLTGCRALDIGCNAGFYSFELARRGASVLGVDHDRHYLAQAAWAREQMGFVEQVELRQLGVYELGELEESFDLVLFMGVLYHLRHPLLALDLVAERVGGTLVLQTLTTGEVGEGKPPYDVSLGDRALLREPWWPKMAFVERQMAGDPTNWWVPNEAAVEAMVRSTGLEIVARPGDETWLCRRPPG